jgi:gas vesicle protein
MGKRYVTVSDAVLTFVAAVVVGGLAALLFSPKSGDEMRSDIAGLVNFAAQPRI